MIRLLLVLCAAAAHGQVMESAYMKRDAPPAADPDSAIWRVAPRVVFQTGALGEPIRNARTEVRSRWTPKNLSFLFSGQFESMKLTPVPSAVKETWGLWDYDVVEVFIGWELDHINRYKEFEVSPQGEWVDLDVDRDRKGKDIDWTWDSGWRIKTRIDSERKVWFCEMQIPWKSIDRRKPAVGNELRLNLYRIEGADPTRKYLAWQKVDSPSYHTPAKFGRLRLK